MTITDADLDYLRNINTSPGPNAGRSIDPTKPGPDADRASPEPQNVRETPEEIARKVAVIELGVSDETFIGKIAAAIRDALAQSDAEPVAWREALEPFAKAADHLERCRDDRPLWAALETGWAQREAIPLTVGDLRRARAALAHYARQMDRRWVGVHGELIPDCPTDGVAARQGNGG
jgi:hypothetical protein